MEKLLICDICGTSYADTEEKCPTCGYSRAFGEEMIYRERPAAPRVKVRGGRYSKKNVQKRLSEQTEEVQQETPAAAPVEEDMIVPQIPVEENSVSDLVAEMETISEEPAPQQELPVEEESAEDEIITVELPEEEPETLDEVIIVEFPEEPEEMLEAEEPAPQPKKKDLWLNVILGFASVVFALSALYLVVRYAVPAVKDMLPAAAPTVVVTEAATEEPTQLDETVPAAVEEELTLNYTALVFNQPTHVTKIFAVGIADHEITWSSDDPAVATVNESGLVTAVSAGTTTVRAVYGEQEAVVTVTCDFE